MSRDVKHRMTVLKRLKAATLEVIRRYHLAVPTFLDLYAGKPERPGPIFAKEAQVLHALTRLLMPTAIVEIGVGGAASTLAFAEALRLNGYGHLTSIDTDPWFIERAQMLLTAHGLSRYATIIAGRSTDPETKTRVIQQVPQIDVLFIDGDHSFDGVAQDFLRYRDLVRPGGLIAFHDIQPDGRDAGETVAYAGEVPQFWRRLSPSYDAREFIADPAQRGLGIGVIRYDPAVELPVEVFRRADGTIVH